MGWTDFAGELFDQLEFVVNRDGDSVHEYYHCVPEDLIPNHTSKEHGTGQPRFSQVQISFPNGNK